MKGKAEDKVKHFNFNTRISETGLQKFNEMWQMYEKEMPYFLRLTKQDAFAVIIDEHYKLLKKKVKA